MSTAANTLSASSPTPPAFASPFVSGARLFLWSVRRELWEYRSIYLAPLAAAALYLVGFLVGVLLHLPEQVRSGVEIDALEHPYNLAGLLIMFVSFAIAAYYCLDALQGERRDRSILFWKSLPVSDMTTVVAKASIPLVVIPLVTFTIATVTQFLMLVLSSAVLMVSGAGGVAMLWARIPWVHMSFGLLDHMFTVHALWYAPFYGWMLLVSAWSRRAALVWATVPPLAIFFVERTAFNTTHFANLLLYHISGGETGREYSSTHLGMAHALASTGLWSGLALTAVFLAGAVRLRRSRGPI